MINLIIFTFLFIAICALVGSIFQRKYEKSQKTAHLIIFAISMVIGLLGGIFLAVCAMSLIM